MIFPYGGQPYFHPQNDGGNGRNFQQDFQQQRRAPFKCFSCGIIGHSSRNCPSNPNSTEYLIREIAKKVGVSTNANSIPIQAPEVPPVHPLIGPTLAEEVARQLNKKRPRHDNEMEEDAAQQARPLTSQDLEEKLVRALGPVTSGMKELTNGMHQVPVLGLLSNRCCKVSPGIYPGYGKKEDSDLAHHAQNVLMLMNEKENRESIVKQESVSFNRLANFLHSHHKAWLRNVLKLQTHMNSALPPMEPELSSIVSEFCACRVEQALQEFAERTCMRMNLKIHCIETKGRKRLNLDQEFGSNEILWQAERAHLQLTENTEWMRINTTWHSTLIPSLRIPLVEDEEWARADF